MVWALARLLHLSRDANEINAVVNDPDVRPYAGAPELGPLDFTQAVADPENWFLTGEFGGFAFIPEADGEREVHAFFMPEGRGRWASQASREAIAYLADHGVSRLIARVADDRRDLALFARRAGMRPTESAVDVVGVPSTVYALEIASCPRL